MTTKMLILGGFAALVLALGATACKGAPPADAVAVVASLGEDLALHRPPAGFCDPATWSDFPDNTGMRLEAFAVEGQPVVSIGKTIQVDFTASMVTAESARARVDMRALLRKSDPPCVLLLAVRAVHHTRYGGGNN